MSTLELFALFRLASNLEEPTRSSVRSLVKQAIQFRRLTVPKKNFPLSLLFLAHILWWKFKAILRLLIIENKSHAVPFHLPTSSPRETSHQKFQRCLFNFKQWTQAVDTSEPQKHCACKQMLHKRPMLTTVEGHIAISASLLNVSQEFF